MPIFKKKDWWYARIEKAGKRWTPSKVGMTKTRWKTKREARQAEAELRERVERLGTTLTSLDLLTLCNEYLKDVKASCMGHDTLGRKQRLCREIIERWGNVPCQDIRVHMAQRYLSERAKKFSNNSFNVYRQEGKRLYAWGIQQELLPRGMRNPFQQVEKKRHEKTKPTPPTIENVGKVYMVATPIQKQILLSYLLTGARKSEILKMELTDADLIKRIYALHTRKSGTGELKTTYHDMSELFYQILKDRFEKRHPNLPYVFWHRYWDRKEKRWREDRYKSLNKFTKRLCQKAGVPHFHLHQLRHLATAILKELGNMDLAKLQRFLRHDKQKTTEIYAGHIETGTKPQTDFLSDFWSKNLPNPDKSSTTASTIQKKTG